MAYILGFIVVGLIFLALHYFTELSKTQKLITSATFLLFISGAIMYNTSMANKQEHILEVAKKFQRGENVVCDGNDVNTTYFDLSIGTYTFIGKENTPHYAQMYRVEECN